MNIHELSFVDFNRRRRKRPFHLGGKWLCIMVFQGYLCTNLAIYQPESLWQTCPYAEETWKLTFVDHLREISWVVLQDFVEEPAPSVVDLTLDSSDEEDVYKVIPSPTSLLGLYSRTVWARALITLFYSPVFPPLSRGRQCKGWPFDLHCTWNWIANNNLGGGGRLMAIWDVSHS